MGESQISHKMNTMTLKACKKEDKMDRAFQKKFKFEGSINVLTRMMVDPAATEKRGGAKNLPLRRGEILDVIQFTNQEKILCRNSQRRWLRAQSCDAASVSTLSQPLHFHSMSCNNCSMSGQYQPSPGCQNYLAQAMIISLTLTISLTPAGSPGVKSAISGVRRDSVTGALEALPRLWSFVRNLPRHCSEAAAGTG
ncbi:hypothetical protein IHE44_0009902 [Lamprotornis superbus]|uniref:Helically-extended SH3 domain-containing protein n=1 Tax=Lamprotornis superbus TaxID=245042 RepID=A0A835NK26_9PASS|nr:hypothetical protein IHE44_0009902 [Lamprotornis superbus]